MPTPINPTAERADDYNQWFLAQIEQAIQETEYSAAVLLTDEEEVAIFADKRAEREAPIDPAKKGKAAE